MSDYTLNIIVNGVDQTGPAQQGMDRLGVGGIAAGNLIAGALQSAAGAVTGFVGSAVSAAGDFQTSMSVMQVASGATSAEMDQMRSLAVALGNDMALPGASAQDAATAMLELSKAGLSVNDTMGAAKGTLQLAAAAETDAATAAGVVAGALNAFGMEGSQAIVVVDQLAGAANASQANITDLANGFQQAGFAFNAGNQSAADLSTSLAALTKVGLTGADSGTALKNAMMALMAPTSAAASEMAKYGINVRDSSGNMLPMQSIIGIFQEKLGSLSPALRDSALKTILMGDGMKAMIPLMNLGVDGFGKLKDEVTQAGSAQALAQAQMAGFNGAMGGLSNAVETLQLVIGTALLPVLTFLINTIASPAINAVTNFIMALQGNADAIGQMSAPMQMLMGFLGSVWAASAQVVEAFNSAGTYSLQFALALGQLGMAFGLPAELLPEIVFSIQSFVDAIYPALDAIGAFVIGTGDLGTVADFLIDLLGVTLGGILTDAIGVLMSYAQVWIDLGATIFNVASALMSGNLAGAWAALTSGLAQVVADYQFYAQSMGALVLEIVNAIVTAVITYAPMIYAQLLTWGQAFVDWITPYIPIALTYLQSYAASIWAWIVEQAPILYQQVLTWGQAFVDWITPYISIALTALGGFAASIWAWIVEQAPGILDKVMAWGQSLVEWVSPQIPVVLGALGEMASSFLSWIGEQAGPILEKLGVWATALVEWIVPATVEFLAAWPGMLSSFLDWIANAVGPIAAGLVDWALEMVAWVAPMIPDLLVAIAGIAAALLTFIAETAIVLVPKVIAWAGAFLGWVATDVLPKIAGVLDDILTRIGSWVDTAVKGVGDEAAKIGKGVVDGIKQGLSDGWGKVTAWLEEKVASIPEPIRKIMGIASPSKVMAQEVGAPIVDGIVAGLVQRSPKAVQAMLDLANSMFDVVNKGVEAFGKLTQLGTIPQSAIANFGDAIMRTLTEFSTKVDQWDKAAMSAASQFTYKAGQVVDFLAKGVELLNGIAALAVPSEGAIRAFADSLAMVMSEIVRVSTFELRLGLTAGVEFASGAKAIAEMIGTGVDALNKLSDFVRPAPGVIQTFVDVLGWLVSRIVLVAQWFDGQALGAAAAFAGATKQIMEVVGAGVDGLLKLAEFVKPAPGVIQTFADTLGWLVSRFVTVGGWMSGPALTAATTFADAAGKVLGVITAGVDAMLKLAAFVRPAPGLIQTFTDVIAWLVSRFAEAATWMSGKALAAAVAFAEGAGKSVGVIGGAVDALGKLSTFVAPLEANVGAFFRSLADFLEKMGSWSANFEADMLEATAAFAEGISKSVAGIGAAADALGKLVTFVAPAEANVSAFFRSLADLLEKMGSWSANFEADMLDATAAFATGIGKSVTGIGAAVDALGKLVEFVAPAEENVSAFFRSLADLLEKMGVWAANFETDMLEATGIFAAGIQKSVAGIGAAADALGKLVDFVAPAEANVSAFFRSLADLLEKMGVWAANFEADMLEATGIFAAGINQAVAPLKGAIESLGSFTDFVPPAQKGISAFFQSIGQLLTQMGALAGQYSAEFFTGTIAFGQNIAKAVETIKAAFELMAGLADLKGIASGVLTKFTDTLTAMLAELERQVAPASFNVGQYLALGIAAGITSGTPAIVNAVYAAINQAILAAKAALGIASPSKVFQQQIGLQMAAGMAGGMTMGAPLVDRAVTDVSGRAVTAAGAQGASSSSTTNIGGLTIVQQPGQNPQQIAQTVIAEIERRTKRKL